MTSYVDSALFVYTEEGVSFIEPLLQNSMGISVTPVSYETVQQNPIEFLHHYDHVVLSGDITFLKKMVKYAMKYDFSIGIIPLPKQKNIATSFSLPDQLDGLIERALSDNAQAVDIILCNEKILFCKATIGRIPLIDTPDETSMLHIFRNSIKTLYTLKLLPFSISLDGEKNYINTAAAGCMIVQHHKKSLASKLIRHDSSIVDGMISFVIVAPMSIIDYLRFVTQTIIRSEKDDTLPTATGYIKNPEITVESEKELSVCIDGEYATSTPLHCRVLPAAVRINIGDELVSLKKKEDNVKTQINTEALPVGKELFKARNKKIPFFTYASEERFKDLFKALRDDAKFDVIYLVLMMLSTILATTGLYLNSSSVIIGAMLLAPLMAPIVSLAMGLLRGDQFLFNNSIVKIVLGIGLALLTAAVMTLFFQYKPVTAEMEARLSPTVLDLLVAITAGVAGAYTKSHKEILQSLAGVAIAVALVPPLAVAGIGIGRLDMEFFSQAFLLFSTNLIGIVLSAILTFRLLGYSAAVKGKRGTVIVCLLLTLISIPLYLSYHKIIATNVFEKSWQEERFLINDKYLIIKNAHLSEYSNTEILTVTILSREHLERKDLAEFKRKMRYNFSRDLVIRANIVYIP